MKTKYKIFIGRIIYFILKIFFNKIHYCKRNKINWALDLSEGIDLSIFLFGTSEKKIYKITKLFNPKKKITIVDIGANIGSVSLILANIYKKSKIYSIEPTKFAFNKLIRNIGLNIKIKKNIVPRKLFITNQRKPKNIYSSWNFKSKKNNHPVHLGALKEVASNSYIKFDDFISRIKKKIDFIKLDVDGYELDVLKSGKKFFKKNSPVIFMEIAPYLYQENGYSCSTLINYIKSFGYFFYDENLNKIKNINVFIKEITYGSSKNIYLLKNSQLK